MLEDQIPPEVPPENPQHARQVTLIVVYYSVLLLLLLWFLLDFWTETFRFMWLFGINTDELKKPIIKTIGYTLVGGAIGNMLYQIRMLYYCYTYTGTNQKRKYNPRWLGKYLSAPVEGAALALVVLSLIRGGIAVFGATIPESAPTGTSTDAFAAFGIGALVGFGTRDVVTWIQNLVKTMFISPEDEEHKDTARDKTTAEDKDKKKAGQVAHHAVEQPDLVPDKQDPQ